MAKSVFAFEDGDGKDKQLLGGKGANLCEMTQIGLNVPPGFVITTKACLDYLDHQDEKLPDALMDEVKAEISALEMKTSKGLGNPDNPLLISVRSGSAMSMPGMMDTILNLGLNSDTLHGLIEKTGNPRFGWDAYRRFIQLFGKVALDIADEKFDTEFEKVKKRAGVKADIGLDAVHLEDISNRFLKVVENATGSPFPQDPMEQLEISIRAVFASWNGKRAVDYRREFNITPDLADGTAVNICTMVFGNLDNDSATGVAFTRYPDTGENSFFGEYLVNAQGEDVVAGIRTPKPIDAMKEEMPRLYDELEELRQKLEQHYREVQDFEFTIEHGKLYCLQTRNGKMNAAALVRTSVEMKNEELITKEEALQRIDPAVLEQLLFPRIDPEVTAKPVARGLPASPGAAVGEAVFDADRAEKLGGDGRRVILIREETKPEDIHGFFASQGILTSRGGKTSHAAVVARGMGKACVAGAEGIDVDVQKRIAVIGDVTVMEGDIITLNGTTGDVYIGDLPMIEAEFSKELGVLLEWADEFARLKVLANADTPEDAKTGLEYGAVGIGLCRTERMFNDPERLPVVVEMILAKDEHARRVALDKLLPMQRSDFKSLFSTMAPHQVTIRLLDPPIHEFLPSEKQLQVELVQLRGLKDTLEGTQVLADTIKQLYQGEASKPVVNTLADPHLIQEVIDQKEIMLRKVQVLHEVNPMLGHRGVRLGLTFPEIYTMQIRAVLEAAAECQKEGLEVHPEIMIPQVCTAAELTRVKEYEIQVKKEVEAQYGLELNVPFGSMLEVVRACLRAESLAAEADFFSFGTNDLSQAVFSFSREDAENKFLPLYNESGILHDNPFDVLDIIGVGKLMELAIEWGRKVKPDMKVGICGEHGGHPASIAFCHKIGLSYVSCSPPRVPIARLAAAQATLAERG